MMRQFGGVRGTDSIFEIGGANSCFLDRIMAEFQPGAYHSVDSNRFDFDSLRRRLDNYRNIILHTADFLSLNFDLQADVVFSVGLIESFEPADTHRALRA